LQPADTHAGETRTFDSRPQEFSAAAPSTEPAPADWTGSYVVRSGDSLYGISRQYKVKLADLQRYNGIQDVRRVKPGTVLKIPADAGSAASAAYTGEPAPAAADPATPRVTQSVNPPTILNTGAGRLPPEGGEKKVVALNQPSSATDASPAGAGAPGTGSVADTAKLRWPAQGKIIAGFGQRPDGTHNDGVNLAVPMGTDIHAAEGGVVAYAGNELKGYGNLILLRHDNGWVTAYAHSEELLVRRGDKVKRGQVIARAGKTGQVDQPQIHFELRQGQRPVDPTPFMERL
jgi:murein DD-endopeptidase MepM/ murein hydrolase activator NlpD